MEWSAFLKYLLVMAGVTYLLRMLPLTIFQKRIRNPFVRSFLAYVPYAVLAAKSRVPLYDPSYTMCPMPYWEP